MYKRRLITVGAGFIGSQICERLPAGHEVLCVDDFLTESPCYVTHLLDYKNLKLVRHVVTFPLCVEVDEIHDLGCPASQLYSQHDAVQTTKTSVHEAINMLGLAKRQNANARELLVCAPTIELREGLTRTSSMTAYSPSASHRLPA